MNLLFESYVGHYLKKKGFDVRLQDKGKYLVDSHQKFALKPDIVINRKTEDKKVIIADTKWKNITEEKDISQSDMYQLFAYGKKYKNNQLYLIYPKLDQKQPKLQYTYCQEIQSKLNLRIVYFDLEKR
jgi:5-methylcytosine-specific restriction enzyme subunit McrC